MRGSCIPHIFVVSKPVDEVWRRSAGADRNQVTLRKHGMRTKVLESFSCKSNYCSEALVTIAEAGQEGCV